MLEQFGSDLRVSIPGIVQSFDAAKQTATIQIAIREKININGELSWVDIPLLVDSMLVVPRGGGWLVAPAIKPDDEVLVIFADFCVDAWYQSGGTQNNQIDKRRHDLSDSFFIPGCWSQPRKIDNYPIEGIQIRNEAGTVKVELVDTTINIVGGDVAVNADSASVTADNIEISGSNVTIGSNTTIDGKSFLAHTHTGVETGGGNTGGVA
jgi:hypothetical protein